mmetsp:Transcript_6882/g.5120  ORF Transcript_6882/g.5120 Transcript_6882/m.5120 type:complete len:103 (-) Transcript_6882:29-337(-)
MLKHSQTQFKPATKTQVASTENNLETLGIPIFKQKLNQQPTANHKFKDNMFLKQMKRSESKQELPRSKMNEYAPIEKQSFKSPQHQQFPSISTRMSIAYHDS